MYVWDRKHNDTLDFATSFNIHTRCYSTLLSDLPEQNLNVKTSLRTDYTKNCSGRFLGQKGNEG